MAEAKISVRSDLLKIAEDLKAISKAAEGMSESLTAAGKEVAKGIDDQVAIVGGGLNRIQKMGKELVRQLGSDLKGLFAVNAMASGLKLNEQFSGAIKQAVNLNDTIRNLSPVFGLTQSRAESFKKSLVKNLSEIGLGADAAADSLTGLAQTPVRGEENLTKYARTAGELAGISKQKGQEGNIAQGLARVVVAQGGNVNDPKAMQKVAEDIVRIRNATGKTATEALGTLEKLFSSANTDFKKRLSGGGGVSLAAAGLIGGEGSTGFLQRFMGMSAQARAGFEAQGLGKLIGKGGELNGDAFQKTVSEAKARGGGNAEFGLQTMGMTEEEAKGFLRLAEAIRTNGDAVERARTQVVDLNQEYAQTRSLGDAFRANINRVKGGLSELADKVGLPDFLNKTTDVLGKASDSKAGAAAVVGGSAILAAMLTSRGIGGIGGLLTGELKAKAIEGATGEKVQKVEVINFPATLGLGGAPGGAGMGLLGKAGLVGLAGGAGYEGGRLLEGVIDKNTQGTTSEGFSGNAVERLIFKLDKLIGGSSAEALTRAGQMTKDVRVIVDSKNKDLKATPQGSRGTAQ